MQNAHALPISPLPDPSIRQPAPMSGKRFGRTALLIYLLAWLALGVAWTMMGILGEYSPERQAAQSVGGANAARKPGHAATG